MLKVGALTLCLLQGTLDFPIVYDISHDFSKTAIVLLGDIPSSQLKFCIKKFVQCWGDGSINTCATKPDNLAHLVNRENKVLLLVP